LAVTGGDLPQPPPSGVELWNHICTVPVPLNAQNSPLAAHWVPGGSEMLQVLPDDELLELELLEDELELEELLEELLELELLLDELDDDETST
jgi:hypothetical protein